MKKDKVCVGAIAGGFGVRGEVRIKSFCANPEDIKQYSPLFDNQSQTYTIDSLRSIKDGFAAQINEIKSKEDADIRRGTRLYADRNQFPALNDDEFYVSDLVGMSAYDGHNELIGKIKSIQNFGAGDLLELHFGKKNVFIPFTRDVVPTVDIDNRKVIIDPPEGLLE